MVLICAVIVEGHVLMSITKGEQIPIVLFNQQYERQI